MPVTSSGQIALRADINQEVNGNDTDTNVSLGTLSDDAGFDTAPDAMSEFYGYSAFTPPTISAQVSTSSVTDTSMRIEFSYANTAGENLESGFYFGTSSTMGNNTFYSEGNSTNTSRSPARVMSSLNASTTYYIWGIVKDTQSPARFTQLATNVKQQATGATLSYSTNQTSGTQESMYNSGSASGLNSTARYRSQYDHTYHSWTTQLTAASTVSNGSGGGRVFYNGIETYRSGVTTSNRVTTSWSTNIGVVPQYEIYLRQPNARSCTLSASSGGYGTHPGANTIGTGTHNLPTYYGPKEHGSHYYCCLPGSYSHTRTFSV